MRWFVLVYWPDFEVRKGNGFFRYLRAYTWEDAKAQLVPARLNAYPWTLAPLEADGSYWTGTEFVMCESLPAMFVPEEREK